MHRNVLVAALALWAATPALTASAQVADPRPPNAPTQKPAFAGQTDAPEKKLGVAFDIVTLSESLRNPWGMTFLPNGKILVTERIGYLRLVNADGTLTPQAVGGLPAVDNRGQGGLLDQDGGALRIILQAQRWDKQLQHDLQVGQALIQFQVGDKGNAVANGGGQVGLRHPGAFAQLFEQRTKGGGTNRSHRFPPA